MKPFIQHNYHHFYQYHQHYHYHHCYYCGGGGGGSGGSGGGSSSTSGSSSSSSSPIKYMFWIICVCQLPILPTRQLYAFYLRILCIVVNNLTGSDEMLKQRARGRQ